jgi:hypothetical protein
MAKRNAAKPSARLAVTNVVTQPPIKAQSAAITAQKSRRQSHEAADTGTIKVQAKRSLNGRHAMKWQCSSTKQKTSWLS